MSSFFALTEQYPDERSAEAYFMQKRWPDGPRCTKCKSPDVYDCQSRRKLTLWKCRECGRQFTVTSGTVMENTRIPLRKWLFAFHMMGGARKGLSTRYLARQLGLPIKTSWHLTHRIRATMRAPAPFFSGGIVESDEAYIGGRRRGRGRGYTGNKIPIQVIVERKKTPPRTSTDPDRRPISECTNECPGRAMFIVLNPPAAKVDGRSVGAKLRKYTNPNKTHLMTDESPIYNHVGEFFRSHDTVNHKRGEYARRDPETGVLVSTNAAEGLIANLKRQILGTHHSVSKKHLSKYLNEHDHKYNHRDRTDTEITETAIQNMEGKRVSMFKAEDGTGESLIDRKQSEKSARETRRGSSRHKRTGRRKEAESATEVVSDSGAIGKP